MHCSVFVPYCNWRRPFWGQNVLLIENSITWLTLKNSSKEYINSPVTGAYSQEVIKGFPFFISNNIITHLCVCRLGAHSVSLPQLLLSQPLHCITNLPLHSTYAYCTCTIVHMGINSLNLIVIVLHPGLVIDDLVLLQSYNYTITRVIINRWP